MTARNWGIAAMATARLDTLLQHIHELAARSRSAHWSDRQLLDNFASRRDETAFSDLISRHGPMVLRVCRRVLQNEHDAEDAFQATFLVLARSSASIRQRESLAGWLHGVAYRTAMKARRSAARRRKHEARLVHDPVPSRIRAFDSADPTWNEVRVALDEEIQALPQHHRSAFVACVLEGKSVPEAAAVLARKAGTVSGWLARARVRLRQRLARRGIELSALLAALAVAENARAGVPMALARATVRFGLWVAAGDKAARTIPSRVAALAAGVTRAMIFTKGKTAAVVLLTAGLLAASVGALTRSAVASRETAAPAAQNTEAVSRAGIAKPQAAKDSDPEHSLIFTGRVLGPDGLPFAGATVSVWISAAKKAAGRARETTGKDGRFRITVPRTRLEPAILVATAEGHGPDWAELPNSIPKDRELTLRLARDDVPINGRLLNLEGRGIGAVTVQVRKMEKRVDDGDLAEFIATKQKWARGNFVNGPAMKNLAAEALPMPTSVTTDADGRFRLTGFGRERVVHLTIDSEAIGGPLYVEVLTRTGRVEGAFTGNENDDMYGATFERVIPPGKQVTGCVREKGSGKPLGGISVRCGRRAVTTDAQGQYRISGIRKEARYTITAQGVPYFAVTKSQVADTAGFEPVRVDFDLERGLAIRGRVIDKASKKPIRAGVQYHAFSDNPHLKSASGLGQGGGSGDDGSFAITGLAGPGLLCVLAEEDDYLKIEPAADWKLVPGINFFPNVAHALVRIDPSEKDPRSATFEIALEPAATVTAAVVGPDGKPFKGYYVAGLTASPRQNVSWLNPRDAPTVRVRCLDVRRPRNVVAFSPEKKLGKALLVSGDETGPVQLRLEPLSSLTGRVLDADGHPWSGIHVRATLSRTGEDGARLPVQFFITEGSWAAKLEGTATTDAEGKFRLDGLLPGLKYTLAVSADGSVEGEGVILRKESVSPPQACKVDDLGDLRSRKLP
jgi:RNA polymerase sigma factor (sigma-70 family)